LLGDILSDHLIGDRPGAHGEITPGPEMATPAEFAEVRTLLKEDPRADTLEPLHDGADILMGAVGVRGGPNQVDKHTGYRVRALAISFEPSMSAQRPGERRIRRR
jgi:hypothetical protein